MKSATEDEKVTRIRARASYVLYQRLYEFLGKKPSVADILKKFHDILDAKRGFGSKRTAECAAECLEWVLWYNVVVDVGPRKQKRPDEDEAQTTSTAHDIAPEKLLGNFVFGDFFADVTCRHGHKVRMFNISRGHYIACDECKTYIFVGSNLLRGWREETKDIWQANYDSVQGYEFIE